MKKKLPSRTSTQTLSCPCGAPVIVDGRRPEGTQTCIVCRQDLTVVVSTDPRTRKRTVGILVRPEAVTLNVPAAAPGSPRRAKTRAPSRPEADLAASGADTTFPLTPDVIGAQPVRTRGYRVFVLCFCGCEIPVPSEDVRQEHRCLMCGLSFQLVLAVEPGTHRAMAITLPRGRAASKTQTA